MHDLSSTAEPLVGGPVPGTRTLATVVYLTLPTGEVVVLHQGSTPPPEHAARITNPAAWV